MDKSSYKSIPREAVIAAIAAALVALGGIVLALVPRVWAWIVETLAGVWAHLTSWGSVPMWWLYLLYVVSGSAVLLVLWAVYENIKKPHWTDYIKDSFFNVIWRWQWKDSSTIGIWAYCPSCDTTLVYKNDHRYFDGVTTVQLICETCSAVRVRENGDNNDLVAKVQRQIDRKLRTGEWRGCIDRDQKTKAQGSPT